MLSLTPCREMEPETGEAEDKALNLKERAVRPAIQVLKGSKGLQEHQDEEQQDVDSRCGRDDAGSDPTRAGTSSPNLSASQIPGADNMDWQKLKKTPSLGKTVRFSETEDVEKKNSLEESLFPDHGFDEWTTTSFEELFSAEDWINITDDRLLRKKVLEPGPGRVQRPVRGQEVTLKMQGVLEDRSVVEKDCKLVFVIGEGDVNQALEECATTMWKEEIALLLADSQYTYGLLGREPEIPAWSPILYQLQLLEIRDKPNLLALSIADRICISNQKRERGNFFYQRDDYSLAVRAYHMALDVLSTCTHDRQLSGPGEEEEVTHYRVKCLNNLAAVQMKLEQYSEALHTSQDVLLLDPNNVKALFRKGKLLTDNGEYEEAMKTLKKALKLEPSTKAIHAELSKLAMRLAVVREKRNPKPAQLLQVPFLKPPINKSHGISWTLLFGALVVALGSLVVSVVLTARN